MPLDSPRRKGKLVGSPGNELIREMRKGLMLRGELLG